MNSFTLGSFELPSRPLGHCYATLGLSSSCVPGGGLLCHPKTLVLCIIITMYDTLRNLYCAAAIFPQVRLKCRGCVSADSRTKCDFNWISGVSPILPRSSSCCCCCPSCFLFIYPSVPPPRFFLCHVLLFLGLIHLYPCSSWLSSHSMAARWPPNLWHFGSVVS